MTKNKSNKSKKGGRKARAGPSAATEQIQEIEAGDASPSASLTAELPSGTSTPDADAPPVTRLVIRSRVETADGLVLADGWQSSSMVQAARTIDLCEPPRAGRGDRRCACESRSHRVVDLCFGNARTDNAKLKPHTLRLRNYTCNADWAVRAPNVVAFVDMRPAVEADWSRPPTAYVPDFPPADRLVVNIAYDPRHTLNKYAALRLQIPPELKHVHILLTPKETAVPRPTARPTFTRRGPLFLDQVLQTVAALHTQAHVRFTLVDTDNWDTAWMTKPPALPPALSQGRMLFSVALATAAANIGERDQATSVAGSISWPTREQYRGVVGDEDYELATVE